MPQTAETNELTVNAALYEGIYAPPTERPTPKRFFDWQIETLVKKFEGTGLVTYAHADPFRNYPESDPRLADFRFILNPPQPKTLDLEMFMALMVLDEATGVNYLNVAYLKDLVEVPATASLLLDVEDGRARLNIAPMVSRENIKSEGRHPYTAWRGIIHGILFPVVLNDHNMDLVGSRYFSDYVPRLYRDGVKPALHDDWEDNAIPKWGAPSVGSVIVP